MMYRIRTGDRVAFLLYFSIRVLYVDLLLELGDSNSKQMTMEGRCGAGIGSVRSGREVMIAFDKGISLVDKRYNN